MPAAVRSRSGCPSTAASGSSSSRPDWSRCWRRTSPRTATAAAGVTGLRLHDLRHFYASGLIASGCDVVTVQRALGHASATTTLSTYSHLWPSAEDRTRTAAQTLLAESCGLDVDWSGTAGR